MLLDSAPAGAAHVDPLQASTAAAAASANWCALPALQQRVIQQQRLQRAYAALQQDFDANYRLFVAACGKQEQQQKQLEAALKEVYWQLQREVNVSTAAATASEQNTTAAAPDALEQRREDEKQEQKETERQQLHEQDQEGAATRLLLRFLQQIESGFGGLEEESQHPHKTIDAEAVQHQEAERREQEMLHASELAMHRAEFEQELDRMQQDMQQQFEVLSRQLCSKDRKGSSRAHTGAVVNAAARAGALVVPERAGVGQALTLPPPAEAVEAQAGNLRSVFPPFKLSTATGKQRRSSKCRRTKRKRQSSRDTEGPSALREEAKALRATIGDLQVGG
ncbi:hypothetical protein cyc_06921 [Cyclospora cayetanensis]|uniref:Uncharacterized protein n=1 Tax=Cyclospora cayetanensis TaxID=88456 RepID=A0A1D3D7K8_9EIME|nr:hypothetical protein cyc_06921 [Cyclospora cayetanensis]